MLFKKKDNITLKELKDYCDSRMSCEFCLLQDYCMTKKFAEWDIADVKKIVEESKNEYSRY